MYLLIPTDAPARVVDATLTGGRISDELEGTYVSCEVGPLVMHVRDEFDGLSFNPGAAFLTACPVWGAVVITADTPYGEGILRAGADHATSAFHVYHGRCYTVTPDRAELIRDVLTLLEPAIPFRHQPPSLKLGGWQRGC